MDSQRIESTAATLNAVAAGIGKFRSTISDYPGRLSDLSTAITSTDATACVGTNYGLTNYVKWNIMGPYYPKSTSRTGFPLPIGTANDQITRTSNTTTAGQLVITVPNVTIDDARDLNSVIDGPSDVDQGGGDNTTGAIQYGAPAANKLVTLTFRVPAGNSC